MKPLLELTGISKDYHLGGRTVPVLKRIDLVVEEGEMLAVMGASGSGKSTLLNIIGCLDLPTGGSYCFAGRDIGKLSRNELAEQRNRKIGFIFQQFNLLARANARKNVELPMLYAGIPAAVRKERATSLLARMGLAGFEHHLPSQLSGGQQQRVAIARALANNPALLLADEPTGQLDSRTGLEVLALFQELHRETGVTVIMVTHDPFPASFCERIIRLRDGAITGEERVENPRDAAKELASYHPAGPAAGLAGA
ncbi:MAG: ABC transporter ATP-binding protein [Desulfotomaculales bacterium]